MSATAVRVALSNLKGDVLELDVDPQCTIEDLKAKVGELWQVPPMCQKMVTADENNVLANSEKLSDHCRKGSSVLSLTMVLSYKGVFKGLSDENAETRRVAVASLAHVAQAGNNVCDADYEAAMGALSMCLEDVDWEVRREAVEVVAKVVTPGDRNAINAVSMHLEDRSASVRQAAILSLAKLVPRGDRSTIDALLTKIEDRDDEVRRAVAKVLGQIAPVGDEQVISTAAKHVQHWSPLIKRAAAEILARVAPAGDESVVALLITLLGEQMGLVRQAAVQCIGEMALKGDTHVLSVLEPLLKDKDQRVRKAAAETHACLSLAGQVSFADSPTRAPCTGSPQVGGA